MLLFVDLLLEFVVRKHNQCFAVMSRCQYVDMALVVSVFGMHVFSQVSLCFVCV